MDKISHEINFIQVNLLGGDFLKRTNKYIKIGIIVCFVVTFLLVSLCGSGKVDAAPARMSGVQKAVNKINENNPYMFVEIVPDKSMGTFGFLVKGFEPKVPESVFSGTCSMAAREDVVREWLRTSIGNSVISNNFFIYEEQLYEPQKDVSEWKSFSFGSVHREERTGSYQKASDYGLKNGCYQKLDKSDNNEKGAGFFEYVGENKADYIWVDDKNGEKRTVEFQKIYYKTNYTNDNWFAEKVLEAENVNIEVKTMTPEEFEEMILIGGISWNEIDLLHLGSSDFIKYENTNDKIIDFSVNMVVEIYNQALTAKLPIFLDEGIFENSGDTNICDLAYLLKGYDETIKIENISDIEAALIQAQTKVASMLATEGVYKNIYFVTDLMDKNLDERITGFYGEQEVITEFKKESFYHKTNGSRESMTEKGTDDTFNISRASLMKYIIHIGNQRAETANDSIRILDIEPTRYSLLDEATIYSWLGIEGEQQETLNIEIVQTTTAAFNGDMTDLMESYDLIYIGSYMGPSMRDGTPLAGAMNYFKNNEKIESVYNNESLNGLIYSDEGDSVEVILESTEVTTKFSGNDITKTKKEALIEYVNRGYPVVISDDLYEENTQKIDVKKVKSSSEIYGFMKVFTVDKNVCNVMKQSNVQSTLLNKYINLAKLTLIVSQKPSEYAEESSSYITNEEDSSALQYVFEFTDDTRVLNEDMYYTLQLFIDSNADGQYSSFEEVKNLQVVDLEWNQVEANHINPGQKYNVSIDAGHLYDGFVSWKLQVTLFETGQEACIARSSEKGYAFVNTEKKKIKVLQVTAKDNDSFMSSTQIKNYIRDVSNKGLYDIQINSLNVKQFLQAGDSVESFYDFIKQYELLVLGFAEDYCEMAFDFSDDSDTINRITMAFYAMEDYVEAGKPLLVSQDTTTYKDLSSNPWGTALNKFIRNIAGLDRHNIVNTSSGDGSSSSGKEGYTNTLLDSMNTGVYHSLSYCGVSFDEATAISQVNKGMITSFPYDLNISNPEHSSTTIKNIVNNSEVTSLTGVEDVRVMTSALQAIKGTHAQTYQLDLDVDKDGDGKSDVIVWYTLAGQNDASKTEIFTGTGDITEKNGSTDGVQFLENKVALINENAYSIMPNDVRNNYFVYSVGNVTYTGQGYHTALSDYEAKLFVNTLIAAYNLGIKSPIVNILSDKENTESVIYDVYCPFDEEAKIFCETDQDIYFHVKDSNVLDGNKRVIINVYERVARPIGNDIKEIIQNGMTIYLKKITEEIVLNQKEIVDYQIDDYVYEAKVSKDIINEVLVNNSSLEIYVGAQVEYIRESENVVQEDLVFAATEEKFAVLEIKKMSLFNLD